MSGIVIGMFQVISSLYVDKWGRKPILISSFISVALSVGSLGVFLCLVGEKLFVINETLMWLVFVAILIFNFAYCFGVSGVVYIVMSEILPPKIAGVGSDMVTTLSWTLAFVTTRYF